MHVKMVADIILPYDTLMSDTQRETCSPETDGWVGTIVCSYPP